MTDLRKILLVDDDPDIRELLSAILERFDFPYIMAASPEEAREAVQNAGDEITDILIDYTLPGATNGIQLADEIKETLPEAEITITSGYSQSMTEPGISEKGYNFLSKPFSPQEFLQILETSDCSTR
ncbi:MAG: response regulator [Opitutales bacterium]|nr:response regulator [Opitutales bacterium]MCH8539300.1 response regulator [Opitutales bacterium]